MSRTINRSARSSLRALLASISAFIAWSIPLPGSAIYLSCSFSSVTPMAFGAYDVYSGTATTSTDSVTILCTGALSPVVATLSSGSGATFSPRRMYAGGATLGYNIYIDSGYTQIFGDGTGGSMTISGTPPLLSSYTQTLYGKIPAGQDASIGSYADSLVLTLMF